MLPSMKFWGRSSLQADARRSGLYRRAATTGMLGGLGLQLLFRDHSVWTRGLIACIGAISIMILMLGLFEIRLRRQGPRS